MAANYDPGLRRAPQAWVSLDQFYFATRYPNVLPGSIPARVYGREVAAGAVGLAREVVEFAGPRIEANG